MIEQLQATNVSEISRNLSIKENIVQFRFDFHLAFELQSMMVMIIRELFTFLVQQIKTFFRTKVSKNKKISNRAVVPEYLEPVHFR